MSDARSNSQSQLPRLGWGLYGRGDFRALALDLMAAPPILFDAASNYRNGDAHRQLRDLLAVNFPHDATDHLPRPFVTTKVGFLTHRSDLAALVDRQIISLHDAERRHSLCPQYIALEAQAAAETLGTPPIDYLFLHNPEHSLTHVPPHLRYQVLTLAFEALESLCDRRLIRAYGIATWSGFTAGSSAPVLDVCNRSFCAVL